MKIPEKYTYDYCKSIAKQYKTRSELHDYSSYVYKICLKKGWLNDFYPQKRVLDYDFCKKIAEQYETTSDFYYGDMSAYVTSRKNKWLDDFYPQKQFSLKKGDTIYSFEICEEIAKICKNRREMRDKNARAYVISLKNNWLDIFFGKKKPQLTYEYCKFLSQKYETKKDFLIHECSAYHKSVKMKWINDFFENTNTPILEINISKYCIENKVEFEYRKRDFSWLKYNRRMELDFFLPTFNAAIECQGIQHYEARDFLGGEKGFNEVVRRDEKKLELCLQHGIKVYYYTTYQKNTKSNTYTNIDDLFNAIKSSIYF